MSCPHCLLSCTAKGKHMSLETVKAACKLAENQGDCLFIGGGEPTLHPHFWEIIGLVTSANAYSCEDMGPAVALVTNGSKTKIALKLASLARQGLMAVSLSQDKWHDPIDPKVIQAFTKSPNRYGLESNDKDLREIRTVTRIKPAGRAFINKLGTIMTNNSDHGCEGDCGTLIDPSGILYRCACKKEIIGDVFKKGLQLDTEGEDNGCSISDKPLVWNKKTSKFNLAPK